MKLAICFLGVDSRLNHPGTYQQHHARPPQLRMYFSHIPQETVIGKVWHVQVEVSKAIVSSVGLLAGTATTSEIGLTANW
jgi:hypothetical protein